MSNFKIRTSYHIYDNDGTVKKTLFELYTDTPTNLITVYLPGKHTVQNASDESDYVKKCLMQFHKEYFSEIEFKETTQKVDVLTKEFISTEKDNKRRDDFIEAMVLNTIMSENIHYGIVYKKLAALLPKAEVGKTYQRNDIVTILDENHTEISEEGKLVVVQFNHEQVYNGEGLDAFENNGKFGQNGIASSWPFKVTQ